MSDADSARDGAPDEPVTDRTLVEALSRALDAAYDGRGDARQSAARRLGDAARQAIECLMATTAPVEVLLRAAQQTEELAEELGKYEQTRSYEGIAEAAGASHQVEHFDWSPILGLSNPLAAPIVARIDGDVVVGEARFGSAYEGPPGCLHGGFVAAAFDEILGMAQSLSGQMGMTATLRVRYLRPTPLHQDLRFEGRLVSVDGRKVTTAGTLSSHGELLAEAEGLFITVSSERFAALAANRFPPRP
jgi:acyl-coenzyme A thioesterase PaaI-like protein